MISGWDVSQVDAMFNLFDGKSNFNGDLSKWDTASVTDFGKMVSATLRRGGAGLIARCALRRNSPRALFRSLLPAAHSSSVLSSD